MQITPAQCRAARAFLDWTQQHLAEAANVGNATIRNFEAGRSIPQNATLDVLRRALESAGVEFTNGGQAGVRIRKIESAAELTRRIDTIEAVLAKTKGLSPQTPEGGMRTLERARRANVANRLKIRRAKLKRHEKE